MDNDLVRNMPDVELAILRRGVDEWVPGSERCRACHRTPLIGERVYVDGHGDLVCALCRLLDDEAELGSRIIHGPAFGNTFRVTDRRAA